MCIESVNSTQNYSHRTLSKSKTSHALSNTISVKNEPSHKRAKSESAKYESLAKFFGSENRRDSIRLLDEYIRIPLGQGYVAASHGDVPRCEKLHSAIWRASAPDFIVQPFEKIHSQEELSCMEPKEALKAQVISEQFLKDLARMEFMVDYKGHTSKVKDVDDLIANPELLEILHPSDLRNITTTLHQGILADLCDEMSKLIVEPYILTHPSSSLPVITLEVNSDSNEIDSRQYSGSEKKYEIGEYPKNGFRFFVTCNYSARLFNIESNQEVSNIRVELNSKRELVFANEKNHPFSKVAQLIKNDMGSTFKVFYKTHNEGNVTLIESDAIDKKKHPPISKEMSFSKPESTMISLYAREAEKTPVKESASRPASRKESIDFSNFVDSEQDAKNEKTHTFFQRLNQGYNWFISKLKSNVNVLKVWLSTHLSQQYQSDNVKARIYINSLIAEWNSNEFLYSLLSEIGRPAIREKYKYPEGCSEFDKLKYNISKKMCLDEFKKEIEKVTDKEVLTLVNAAFRKFPELRGRFSSKSARPVQRVSSTLKKLVASNKLRNEDKELKENELIFFAKYQVEKKIHQIISGL